MLRTVHLLLALQVMLLSYLLNPFLQTAESSGAPSQEQLKNATYGGFSAFPDPVTLVNGRWEGKPYAEGSGIKAQIHFVDGFSLVGDLDKDSKDEAVVLLNLNTGGTGQLLHLAAVGLRDGQPVNLATRKIGDRIQIRGGRIQDGRIFLDVVQAGAEDARCCPGEVTTHGYVVDPPGFMKPFVIEDKPGRLTLDTIGNTEWGLHSWDVDHPVPTDSQITLVHKNGRFSGKNGCNNYFAPAAMGDMPGDVRVGPAGSTKMACPEPAGAVETRFMAQLANTKKFGFLAGKLALTYEKDGAWGTMLFVSRPEQSSEPAE